MDRLLSPSCLEVLRRTETIPVSLGWQKASIQERSQKRTQTQRS